MSGNHQEMDRVLKSINQLASMLAEKLKGSEDHKPLDQILKELSKYVTYLSVDCEAESVMVASIGRWKKKKRRSRLCRNDHFLSEWLRKALMRESLFPHVKQLEMHSIHST